MPQSEVETHYTEADIMHLRTTGKDDREILTHLGLKASSPSYQLASDHSAHLLTDAHARTHEHSKGTIFSLVPHQEFERQKQLRTGRGQSWRTLGDVFWFWSGSPKTARPVEVPEELVDVRDMGLKPRYLSY
ncbi:MAG: hypothetical protein Q9162_000059 [Coniocarpon cinnabarinum]